MPVVGKHRAEQCNFPHYTLDSDDLSIAIMVGNFFCCCSVHFYSNKCVNQDSMQEEKGSQLLKMSQSDVQNSLHNSSLRKLLKMLLSPRTDTESHWSIKLDHESDLKCCQKATFVLTG